jgi:hypothetical protein
MKHVFEEYTKCMNVLFEKMWMFIKLHCACSSVFSLNCFFLLFISILATLSLCLCVCYIVSVSLFLLHFHCFYVLSECSKGRWECEDKPCAQQCTVLGNQHFLTFDGKTFDYQGASCYYTLVEVSPIVIVILVLITP